jgi:protein TorT
MIGMQKEHALHKNKICGKKVFLVLLIYSITKLAFALETANYYGNYDVATKKPWRAATSLTGPNIEKWTEPTTKKAYKIGVLLPQVQDSYWIGVNYSLVKEAEKLGVTLKIFNAGGYHKGGLQRKQLTEDMLKEKVDGIILASIFYDKLDRFIGQITTMGTPVVAMINDVLSPHVKAEVTASYYDVGYKLGEFVLNDAAGKNIRIAFFPGPKQAVWAVDTYEGFVAAFRDNKQEKPVGKVTVVALQYEALDPKIQQQLVDKVLEIKPDINYIIGNALAAKAASTLVKEKYQASQAGAKIISSYLVEDIYELLKAKNIYASAVDFNIDQARMALHLMIRYLNGEQPNKQAIKFPFRTAPLLKIITKDNIGEYKEEQFFAAKSFKPVYETATATVDIPAAPTIPAAPATSPANTTAPATAIPTSSTTSSLTSEKK